MQVSAFKYLSPVIIYTLAALALTSRGLITWSPMMFAWVVMPVAELFLSPDKKNLSAAEEELAKKDRLYDYLLYAIVILRKKYASGASVLLATLFAAFT